MKYLFSLGWTLFVPVSALAQDPVAGENAAGPAANVPITVIATGSDVPIAQSGQSISVVGADEIRSVQGPDLTRVIERLPGVTVARNGGLGSATSLFVRGAGSEQLLVLVDGVRVNDIAAPSGGYDLGNLLAGGIGRIELLRGSNSVIWGSQAIGGVLSVTSRELHGVDVSAEYGARDTFDGQVNAGLAAERYAVTLNGGYTRSDGVSAAAAGIEPDRFRQWRVGGRGRVELMPALSLIATARYADGRLGIDGFPAPSYTFADTDDVQRTREASALGGLQYRSDSLSLTADYAISDLRRRYTGESYPFPYVSRGRGRRAELFGAWTIAGALRLDFGGDSDWSRFSTSTDPRHEARLSSGHALLGWYGDRLDLAAGVRIDDHSRFGSEWTFGANGSYRLAGALRVRASYGEGFKVPTLYQLFSDYGTASLVPEKSRSVDAGIEYADRNAPLHLALTGFRRDSRDLIDFVSCFASADPRCVAQPFGFYGNLGRARASGIEVELGARVSPDLRAQAAYSYIEATNRTSGSANRGNDLARRARHAVTVSADWTPHFRGPLHGLALGGDIRMVGDSFDDAGNFTRIDGFALVTLRASVPLTGEIELYGRVENLTDESYRTAAGYGTAGRSGYVGIRARL